MLWTITQLFGWNQQKIETRTKLIFLRIITLEKIPHTGNTRSSCVCVIQEYWYYTMSLSQHHGCCQHHKSISIPWVFVNTMGPCIYHDSMSKTWVHVYTMSPCLYHESLSNPCFHFYTMRNTIFIITKIQITGM